MGVYLNLYILIENIPPPHPQAHLFPNFEESTFHYKNFVECSPSGLSTLIKTVDKDFFMRVCFCIHLVHPMHPPLPVISPHIHYLSKSLFILSFNPAIGGPPSTVPVVLLHPIHSVFSLFHDPRPCIQKKHVAPKLRFGDVKT